MSYNITTGLSTHRVSVAQLGDIGLLINGHDPNLIFDLRTGDDKPLGIAAPGAFAASAANGAGSVDGTVRYRARWKDQSTGTISLPGTETTATPAANTWRLTIPASAPTRATHWIVERTTDGGRVFYPVNVTAAAPDGTAVGTTTFDDNVSDATLRNRTSYPSNQGQPPVLYRFGWANGPHLFMGGGRVHKPTVTLTSGAATCTSTDGDFTSDMVGQDISIDADTDGKTYRISAFTNANDITLASNYSGSFGGLASAASISGVRDRIAWCESGEGEYWGSSEYGTLSNVVRIGSDGEPVTAGIGLGPPGCLIAKESSLYMFSYRLNPQGIGLGGDGRIIPLQSKRGAFAERCLKNIDGRVYGMDSYGVWRLDPGGEPREIGDPIQADWRALNFAQRDNFWIGYDPTYRLVYFCVCESGITYPQLAYLWDLDAERWVGTKNFKGNMGITCGTELPDANGQYRLIFATENVSSSGSYFWFDNIGTNCGAPPSNSPMSGTATGGSSTTIVRSGSSFYTTGEALKGVPVTLVRAADSSEETRIIQSNTSTTLTTNAFTGTAPTSGDTFYIGAVDCQWRTGRIAPDPPNKVFFKMLYLWIPYDTGAVDLWVRTFLDGSSTAFSDRGISLTEDGVTITASTSRVDVDPGTAAGQCFQVPIGAYARDCQILIYSLIPGTAWQVMDLELEWEIREGAAYTPRKK